MGIEYNIKISDFDEETYEKVLDKIVGAIDADIDRSDLTQIEFRFDETSSSQMPDAVIQRSHSDSKEIIFLYYGGFDKSWAVLGLLTSYLVSWFPKIEIQED